MAQMAPITHVASIAPIAPMAPQPGPIMETFDTNNLYDIYSSSILYNKYGSSTYQPPTQVVKKPKPTSPQIIRRLPNTTPQETVDLYTRMNNYLKNFDIMFVNSSPTKKNEITKTGLYLNFRMNKYKKPSKSTKPSSYKYLHISFHPVNSKNPVYSPGILHIKFHDDTRSPSQYARLTLQITWDDSKPISDKNINIVIKEYALDEIKDYVEDYLINVKHKSHPSSESIRHYKTHIIRILDSLTTVTFPHFNKNGALRPDADIKSHRDFIIAMQQNPQGPIVGSLPSVPSEFAVDQIPLPPPPGPAKGKKKKTPPPQYTYEQSQAATINKYLKYKTKYLELKELKKMLDELNIND